MAGAFATSRCDGRRRAGGGDRRPPSQKAVRGRHVLLSGRGLFAAGREGTPLVQGLGAVRRDTRRPRTGGYTSFNGRSPRSENAALAATSVENLWCKTHDA